MEARRQSLIGHASVIRAILFLYRCHYRVLRVKAFELLCEAYQQTLRKTAKKDQGMLRDIQRDEVYSIYVF